MENTDLFKTRSYSGCLRDAFEMMSSNFTTIFRHTWKPIFLSSLMAVVSMLYSLPDKDINDLGSSHAVVSAIISLVTTIVSLLAASWLLGELYSLLNDHGRKTNFKRGLALQIFSILLLALYFFNAFSGASIIVYAVVTLLFFICLFPLAFAQTKFVADKTRTFHDIFMKDYAQGWRHFGYIFITALLTGIIIFIIGGIIMVPLCVVLFAQTFNQLGMLDGDSNGAPGYFFALLLVTAFLTFFLLNFLFVWNSLVQYYMYGSIEATDREKALRKQAMIENNSEINN